MVQIHVILDSENVTLLVSIYENKFKTRFPLWFIQWWRQFGPIPEAFPEKLQKAIKCFATILKIDRHNKKSLYFLHFCKKYKVS